MSTCYSYKMRHGKRSGLAALAILTIVSCSLAKARVETVTFAHSSGGPGPHAVFVTIDSTGGIVRDDGSLSLRGKVDERLALALIAEVKAESTRRLLEKLRAKGYQSGCCDREDIYVEVDGVITEAPVDDLEIKDTEITARPVLPAAVIEILRKVDGLAEMAFGAQHSYAITPRLD